MRWYDINAKKGSDKATILIYEQIGRNFFDEGISAKEFFKDLEKLNVKKIDLHINSPGGNVFEGNSIYNVLKAHPAKIDVKIDGIAASIASVIAMAGDSVVMPENAMMMIHDPVGGVLGTSDDMLKMAEALEKVKTGIVASYMTRSTLKEKKISNMMKDETWITAEDAVEYGLADEVLEPVNIQASFSFRNYKNTPQWLIDNNRPHEKERTNTINKRLRLSLRHGG